MANRKVFEPAVCKPVDCTSSKELQALVTSAQAEHTVRKLKAA